MAQSRPTSVFSLMESSKVPAGFRKLIIENDLSKNDILVLLLILERTLDNVRPSVLQTPLSIRYIASQNTCVNKTAENSVNKLKALELVTQKTFPKTDKASLLSLNYYRFPCLQRISSNALNLPPKFAKNDLAPSDAASRKAKARAQAQADKPTTAEQIEIIREIMQSVMAKHLKRDKKQAAACCPGRFLPQNYSTISATSAK